MPSLDARVLEPLSKDIVKLFRDRSGYAQSIPLTDYHGFQKGKVPSEDIGRLASEYGVNPNQIQAELVLVNSDLSGEVHKHSKAHAYCTILGSTDGVDDPRNAFAFLADNWSPVRAGNVADIPPNTPHGFTIKPPGILYFLSVQSPPIEGKGGHDDYIRVGNIPRQF
jgi:mannose-6-phosphate isomerase-like protein (cupin superfamily)